MNRLYGVSWERPARPGAGSRCLELGCGHVQRKALVVVFHCRTLLTACRIGLGASAVMELEFAPQPELLWVATSDHCLQCFDATAGSQREGRGCNLLKHASQNMLEQY